MNGDISTVGISISEPDGNEMGKLGIGLVHLQDAMVETARFLLSRGYKLAYGGDLNYVGAFNFTELLFQLGRTYGGIEGRITNYSALPYYTKITEVRKAELVNIASIVKINPSDQYNRWTDVQYNEASAEDRQYLDRLFEAKDEESFKIVADSLTVMRKKMTNEIQCRIVMGGKTIGYKGRMPGIWEETLLCLEEKIPVYIDGRFGGAASQIIHVTSQPKNPALYNLGERINVIHHASWQEISPGVMYAKGNKEFVDIHNMFTVL